MYIQRLKNIMISQNLNQADIAGLAMVSRASVTRWFNEVEGGDWVNVETKTIIQLASALKMTPDYFLKPISNLKRVETRFLWDRLYPNMEYFLVALRQRRPAALARLVQVLGFYEAMKIVGKMAVKKFHQYAKYIKPVRRKQLEILWPLYSGGTVNHKALAHEKLGSLSDEVLGLKESFKGLKK